MAADISFSKPSIDSFLESPEIPLSALILCRFLPSMISINMSSESSSTPLTSNWFEITWLLVFRFFLSCRVERPQGPTSSFSSLLFVASPPAFLTLLSPSISMSCHLSVSDSSLIHLLTTCPPRLGVARNVKSHPNSIC